MFALCINPFARCVALDSHFTNVVAIARRLNNGHVTWKEIAQDPTEARTDVIFAGLKQNFRVAKTNCQVLQKFHIPLIEILPKFRSEKLIYLLTFLSIDCLSLHDVANKDDCDEHENKHESGHEI